LEPILWQLLKRIRFIIVTAMDNDQSQKTTPSMAIIAIVAALGLLGVVIVNTILTAAQVTSAAKPPTQGCRTSIAVNASQARCFHG
jgi:hypothetical protein